MRQLRAVRILPILIAIDRDAVEMKLIDRKACDFNIR